jgi:hypothetical protein
MICSTPEILLKNRKKYKTFGGLDQNSGKKLRELGFCLIKNFVKRTQRNKASQGK